MDIRRIGAIKDGTDVIGNKTKVKVVKNKIAPPFKEAEFDIMYGTGISKTGDVLDLGVEMGLVEKSGTWYSFGEERIGQGRENTKTFLAQPENQDLFMKLEKAIKQKLGLEPGQEKKEAEKKTDA